MMDKVRKPSNSVCYTPSPEPYRIYMSYDMYAMGIAFKPRRVQMWFVVNRMARRQILPAPSTLVSLPIIVPLMLHTLIYHQRLAQWARLRPQYQGTQFYRAARIEKKERKMQQEPASEL
jgi:hypothetical protein